MLDSRKLVLVLALYLLPLFGCEAEDQTKTVSAFVVPEKFDCENAMPGWKRASAITPDVVPPCMTGSSGSCDEAEYSYVAGTGWCRPR
jgi:hypothetical protein